MLKKIGKTFDGLDIYKLDNKVAVTQIGEILKINKNEFLDTIYMTQMNPKEASVEDIKNTIYCPKAIDIDNYLVDTIACTIDDEKYMYLDIEGEGIPKSKLNEEEIRFIKEHKALEFVKYKDNCFIFDKNDEIIYLVNNEDTLDELEIIVKALAGELTEFEDYDFINLDAE